MKLRRILTQKRKRRHDAPCIPKTNHERRADTALRVAYKIHDVPAYDDGARGEGTHGDEADAEIFDGEVVPAVHGEEDAEAGDCEGDADGDEGGAEAEAVGEVGEDEGEAEGGGDGGDGVQLGLDGVVAEGSDDGGGEVGVCCEGWSDL